MDVARTAPIREQVAAVALSGDVIEHSNRFFEAIGTLERGVKQLAEYGIPVYAVAGNHDWDVLPRIVDAVGAQHFHLLGRGGNWESAELRQGGKAVLRFQGWSFPSAHFPTSPLSRYSPPDEDGLPTIALLHCDLDQTTSRYAPVTRADLTSRPVSFWLLGHVHAPQYYNAGSRPPILYPGSPQALDPGEIGSHGPWLIEIRSPFEVVARQLNLSAVRYEQLEIDVTGLESLDAVEAHAYQTVRDAAQQLSEESDSLKWLILRLQFAGAALLGSVLNVMAQRLPEDMRLTLGDLQVHIDTASNDTRVDIDLEAWSRRKDAPGTLAGLILQLESGKPDPKLSALLDKVHQRVNDVYGVPVYRALTEELTNRDDARNRLSKQARRLLEALQAQETPT